MSERFELLEQVGKGGMGAVWKARDTQSGEIVALKVPWEQFAADSYFIDRLQREVDVTRRIDSPHVAKTLGFGRRDGRPFIAMEFVEGVSLREFVKERGKLSWDEARPILRQVALGLDAAHRAGVVHRDVKPSNVIVGPEGAAKLVDFGIARAEDMTALTGSRTTIGTPAYAAPEGTPSPQADLYGLGCIAYELLAGRQVFEGETQQEVMLKHIREQPDLSRLPSEARPVVAWLLQKRPVERPKSAGLAAEVLEGTTKVPRGAIRSPRWQPIALGVGGVMAVALAAVLAPLLLLGGGDDDGGEAGSRQTPTASATSATVRILDANSTSVATLGCGGNMGPFLGVQPRRLDYFFPEARVLLSIRFQSGGSGAQATARLMLFDPGEPSERIEAVSGNNCTDALVEAAIPTWEDDVSPDLVWIESSVPSGVWAYEGRLGPVTYYRDHRVTFTVGAFSIPGVADFNGLSDSTTVSMLCSDCAPTPGVTSVATSTPTETPTPTATSSSATETPDVDPTALPTDIPTPSTPVVAEQIVATAAFEQGGYYVDDWAVVCWWISVDIEYQWVFVQTKPDFYELWEGTNRGTVCRDFPVWESDVPEMTIEVRITAGGQSIIAYASTQVLVR